MLNSNLKEVFSVFPCASVREKISFGRYALRLEKGSFYGILVFLFRDDILFIER